MKPPAFGYLRPATVDEVLACLAAYGDTAKVLAGGQSLIPLLNFRLTRPEVLIDLGGIDGLDAIAVDDSGLRIGALARQSVVERSSAIRPDWKIVADALGHVGHVQIRHRGTIGGSLAHADPAAEIPAVALLLDAVVEARSASGTRSIPIDDFLLGPFTTSLRPDELIVEIRVPRLEAATAFAELSRRAGDFALVGVAAASGPGGARLVAFATGWRATRLRSAEAIAAGGDLTADRIEAAAEAAIDDVEVLDDVHADARYRRDALRALVARTLRAVAA